MKRFWLFFLIVMLTGVLSAQDNAKETDEDDEEAATTLMYVGVKACAKCHKTTKQGKQYQIWKDTKHAQAFETLKTPEAVKIAKEKGIAKAPHEAPECLQCHVTGYDAPAEMKSARFSIEDGVQCETCHGPGSLYKPKKIMKDRQLAIEKGMKPIFVKDGSAEKQCREKKKKKSPTFKEFNFEERWKKIDHPLPDKK